MSHFLVIGESVADIVRTCGHPDVPHPGGSPANVAYGLARLGHRTALLTQLGQDPMGDLIRSHLASADVQLLSDGQGDVRTPTAVISLDGDGKASYEFDIAWTLHPVPLTELSELTPAPVHVHLGSIAAVVQPGADATLLLAEQLREAATISYDPNIRPALMGERTTAVRQVERCVAVADVIKASDEDLAWLYPDEPEIAVAARWLKTGPTLVLVTRGAAGAAAYTPAHTATAPGRTTTVVDTVGAGDSFMSAALHALRTLAPDRATLTTLGPDALRELLHQATTAAAITVSRPGANPPDSAELRGAL